MKSQGLRIRQSTKDRVELLLKLRGGTRSEIVAKIIDSAPPLEPLDATPQVQVSYSLADKTLAKLQSLAAESGRTQAEVVDYLVRRESLN